MAWKHSFERNCLWDKSKRTCWVFHQPMKFIENVCQKSGSRTMLSGSNMQSSRFELHEYRNCAGSECLVFPSNLISGSNLVLMTSPNIDELAKENVNVYGKEVYFSDVELRGTWKSFWRWHGIASKRMIWKLKHAIFFVISQWGYSFFSFSF